jgi:hypothetical protein
VQERGIVLFLIALMAVGFVLVFAGRGGLFKH